MPKPSRKPRKDQEIVDLADKIRKGLGDGRPKSFGLYVKLIKEFGTRRVNDAFWRTVRSEADDKIRYFLGILSHMRSEKQAMRVYRSMRAPLLEKLSPPAHLYQKVRGKRPQWQKREKRNTFFI